jgi:deoxyadenosine/deoxycytidine kinase
MVIVVEGLIASGKSTLLDLLKNHPQFKNNTLFIEEPVEMFRHYKGYYPLNLQLKNTFASQYYIMGILKDHYTAFVPQIPQFDVIISERCFDSPYVFTDALFRYGLLSDFEKDLLRDVYSRYISNLGFPSIDGIFYLTASPDKCYYRAVNRGREDELQLVTINYLKSLEITYKAYLESTQIPVRWAQADITEPCALLSEFLQFVRDVERSRNFNNPDAK